MKINKQPGFTWSDAWLLFSIAPGDGGGGASLASLIRAGDRVNHAIFTTQELRRGLAKLFHAGYLTKIDNQYTLAGKAKTFWFTQREQRKPTMDRLKVFEAFLEVDHQLSLGSTIEDPDWHFPGITDETVHLAYLEYINSEQKKRESIKMVRLQQPWRNRSGGQA